LTHFVHEYGLWFLFVIIGLESAGVWLPGETALIAAAVYASQGHLPIEWVLVVAAAAAILGDNVGYWIGREGGRRLLRRLPRVERVLPPAERFFARHGAKAVFFGRFFALLRVTAAWLAGVSKMPWWKFLLWNAAGGLLWGTGCVLLGYAFASALSTVGRYLTWAPLAILAAVIAGYVVVHFRRHRRQRDESTREVSAGAPEK
jgi:membrane-associated protein